MAVILYKAGGGEKIRGIPCQVQICNEFSYKHLLEQGWCYSPEECYAEKEEEKVTEDTEEETTDTETEDIPIETTVLSEDELTEAAIREAAKNAGISSWHVKSIERLTKELEELEDGEQPED